MIQTIKGNTPSKSNCYGVNPHAHGLFKTAELKKYEESFYMQCHLYRNKMITGLFEIQLNVWYPSQRSDLDNSLKVILDCLQACKAIKNDNQCVKITAQKFLDKTNPRIEFELIKVNE